MSNWPLHISVYGAGDAAATGAFASLQRFLWRQVNDLSREITNESIAGTVQFDGATAPSFRTVLDPRGRFRPIRLSETNTGNPGELVEFAQWALRTCPADQMVLILSGHGLAFQDAATERLLSRGRGGMLGMPVLQNAKSLFGKPNLSRALLMDQSDFLSVPELSSALEAIAATCPEGRINTVVFDACLMSNLEILYEIAPFCSHAVGAMDEISGAGLNLSGAAQLIRHRIQRDDAAGSQIAQAFAEVYKPQWPTDSCVVVDLHNDGMKAGLKALKSSVRAMSDWLDEDKNRATTLANAISAASATLVRYKSKSLSDIAAIATTLKSVDLPNAAQSTFQEAAHQFGDAVVARKAGTNYSAAMGLSLFAPTDRYQFSLHAGDHAKLKLARKTGWHDLLARLYLAA